MRTTSHLEGGLRRLWAIVVSIVVSIIVFFLITDVVFALSPGSPYSNNPFVIQFGKCPSPSAAQAVKDFYQFNEPTYVQYFTWLTHALTGQWQPQLPDCQLQLPADSSPFYFEVGMLIWVASTVALLAYSLVSHRTRPLDSSAQHLKAPTVS
jgi:ABC-type dipeptide/oligopeptide/nickel transport system permease component